MDGWLLGVLETGDVGRRVEAMGRRSRHQHHMGPRSRPDHDKRPDPSEAGPVEYAMRQQHAARCKQAPGGCRQGVPLRGSFCQCQCQCRAVHVSQSRVCHPITTTMDSAEGLCGLVSLEM